MNPGGGDPHRVLGVPHDASEAEIKRAYRALAKRHHPDGGHGSVTRFLEVQAAYESLVSVDRPGATGGPSRRPGGAARPTARPGTEWARRPRPDSSRRRDRGPSTSASQDAGPRPATDPARGRRTSGRRGATLGSTSYDEADEGFEPGWGGASWYGPSSGTYWTLNPREYADPRKHGPEYQARARRSAADPRSGPAAAASLAHEEPEPAAFATPASTPAPAGREVVARILARWRRGRIRE